ncbi:MAG: tRNA isopentenyl-2-thiomethyl-A-37 hydroxylase MiaE [Pseudomonadota bacterium]
MRAFLRVPTPDAWLAAAAAQQDVLLIDHANCEKKAASTALSLLYRADTDPGSLAQLSRLAREELRHYEQVLAVLEERGIPLRPVSSSRYASGLRERVARSEPWRRIETLLVCALVEARSCERFDRLTEVLDPSLARFYGKLLASEARHFEHYLSAAQAAVTAADLEQAEYCQRLDRLLEAEAELVSAPDSELRFHSGPPAT